MPNEPATLIRRCPGGCGAIVAGIYDTPEYPATESPLYRENPGAWERVTGEMRLSRRRCRERIRELEVALQRAQAELADLRESRRPEPDGGHIPHAPRVTELSADASLGRALRRLFEREGLAVLSAPYEEPGVRISGTVTAVRGDTLEEAVVALEAAKGEADAKEV